MEFITQHPWRDLILKPLPQRQLEQAIPSDNGDWEYIDTEMAKLGTISHETVNIPDVQDRILKLLAEETKDFRLLTHLLNTLQRSERPASILLAIALLADYVEAYWSIAAPQKNKLRIAQMIIQRFVNAKELFSHSAIAEEREQSISEFVRLKQLWQEQTALCEQLDKLIVSYSKSSISELPSAAAVTPTTVAAAAPSTSPNNGSQTTSESKVPHTSLPHVMLDDSSERAWSKTLLKIAEIEAERSFTTPISFQLRRHAVWFNIATPPAVSNGVTSVPALPIEKISEFERELSRPSLALWLKVENTIAYSPFWFDGHYLSAAIANKLGHPTTADVIKNELKYFLARFSECQSLCFSNGEPFMNPQTQKWLNQKEHSQSQSEDFSQALSLFNSEGLQSALTFLEQTTGDEPRSRSYTQLQTIKLLHQAGCHKLGKQQLENLVHKAAQLSAKEWEPSFFDSCNGLKDSLGNKE
ncbi:Uncharacterized protein conserved in bacteria [Pragia fontium]|uniref:Type VI secretion system protein VasJ n=1 Tax=Pragia fontium DSM 5563 = ATCC 49100 TaxID=1122977 RepID=A0AAJ4W8L0_9GAMM|nr:type VI secretion system protein TssA [Pragia fontium]AKJ41617.1 hypothetical protein QQ39_05565 [Pragia fontium]SFC30884.1 type VI secretion system protein VasJ [Pragia fontium DSM 5563 = ATCC 49100]SUB81840.1 Uncharacterized protein conserved in bacteria [Pragia fontium]